jgi:hypothetical protein
LLSARSCRSAHDHDPAFRHARYVALRMAGVAIWKSLVAQIPRMIAELRAHRSHQLSRGEQA